MIYKEYFNKAKRKINTLPTKKKHEDILLCLHSLIRKPTCSIPAYYLLAVYQETYLHDYMLPCLLLEGHFHYLVIGQIVFECLFCVKHGSRCLEQIPHVIQHPKIPIRSLPPVRFTLIVCSCSNIAQLLGVMPGDIFQV